jgi:hypothetical protein
MKTTRTHRSTSTSEYHKLHLSELLQSSGPAPFRADNFGDPRACGALRPVGFLPPPYDTSMPVYRADGGGFFSFDAPAGAWLMTPTDPRLTDQQGWLYRCASVTITDAWVVRAGMGTDPAGTITATS